MELLYTSLVLLAAGTLYEPENRPIIPDLPSAHLELNWADLKSLLEQIQPAREESLTKSAPPPIPWIINSVMFTADATAASTARVEAEYQFHLWAAEWSKIPLFGAEVALESATLDGNPTFPFTENGQFTLLLNEPGLHEFKAVFHVPLARKGEETVFEFPCARSSVSRMALHLGDSDVLVSAPTAASIRSSKTGNGKVTDMIFRGSDKITVSWKLPPKPAPPKETPLIACNKSTLATVSERLISCQSLLQFDVLRSDTREFRLRLPVNARVTSVAADAGEWTSQAAGDFQIVVLSLKQAVKNQYDMVVHYEVPIPESVISIVLPHLEVLDLTRQSGFLAVATRGPVETSVADLPTGIRQIDTNDLPAALRMQALDPILHAFSVTENAVPPVLNLRRLKEVSVQVAVIDEARYESVITDEGLMLTRAAYVVRNNLKKFLRVDLGPDVEVWSATVSGREVRPARENDDGASTAILIPLAKSNETGRRVNAFPVELYYFQRLPELTGWTETLSLTAPTTDITANYVTWEVLLPESQRVYHTLGDFTWVTHLPPVPHAPAPQNNRQQGTVSFATPGGSTETLHRLREGMEKNRNPNSAPVSVRPAPVVTPAVTSIQPVQMELPQVGNSHYFERHLVPENSVLRLELRTYNSQLASLLNMVRRAVALVFGFIVVSRLLKHFTPLAQVNTAVVFVLAAVAAHYLGMSFFAFTGWTLLGAIPSVILELRRSLARVSEEV